MSVTAAVQSDPDPIIACTISRDVQHFDLLIEDMEAELGEAWGDLTPEEALAFFQQPDARALEFVAISMTSEDESDIAILSEIIAEASKADIKVIMVAQDVSPITLHQLLKLGAEEFIPYPLPEGALHDAISRIRKDDAANPAIQEPIEQKNALEVRGNRQGVVLAVHSMAGGTGATTLAVNLAWELAVVDKKTPPRVCLLDFGLQSGSVATYLDLPRRDSVYELLADTDLMDQETFMQATLAYEDTLHVLTAPPDMLPLDLISGEDIDRIIEMARANFDFVVIDMPGAVVQWTENVLNAVHVYFATIELDLRSAQNTLRMVRALRAEELPVEKLRYALNRAPKFTDLSGKTRVKRLAESLDISIELQLPDGGKQVTQANDRGEPLAIAAKKNPLRREIQRLAKSVNEVYASQATGG